MVEFEINGRITLTHQFSFRGGKWKQLGGKIVAGGGKFNQKAEGDR
jgi:hypothetical protein